jgi:transcriptional regulator with XRE-family HTH domain
MNLTQEVLAERVDTASTYIAMIESGKRTPSFKMIERIAKVLKIEATELFSTKDYPTEKTSQLRGDLIDKFDKFLRAAVKEIEEKNK